MLLGHHVPFLPSTEHCVIPSVPSWSNILHGENAQPPQTLQTRKTVKIILYKTKKDYKDKIEKKKLTSVLKAISRNAETNYERSNMECIVQDIKKRKNIVTLSNQSSSAFCQS